MTYGSMHMTFFQILFSGSTYLKWRCLDAQLSLSRICKHSLNFLMALIDSHDLEKNCICNFSFFEITDFISSFPLILYKFESLPYQTKVPLKTLASKLKLHNFSQKIPIRHFSLDISTIFLL